MRRVIRRHIRRRTDGLDLAVDVNAVIAVNRGDFQSEVVTSRAEGSDATRRPDGAERAEPDRKEDPNKEDR